MQACDGPGNALPRAIRQEGLRREAAEIQKFLVGVISEDRNGFAKLMQELLSSSRDPRCSFRHLIYHGI